MRGQQEWKANRIETPNLLSEKLRHLIGVNLSNYSSSMNRIMLLMLSARPWARLIASW